MLAQQIVNGLVVGNIYALFALGFTLIFGVNHIMNMLPGRAPAEAAGTAAAGAPAEVTSLADLEREAVSHALCVARYNVSRAAEMLDVTKPRLYRMIRRHGIRLQRTGRKASGFGG